MKEWLVREAPSKETSDELAPYGDMTKMLLSARGITSFTEAEKFLEPDYERDIHDPFLIDGMEKAVQRLLEAIEGKEKIIIFADYDADGIPGSVILNDFFKKIEHENFEVYIPHRNKEGFGLSINAIEKFKNKKAKILITIDCGITNLEEIEKATEYNIDVIITDHHLPGKKLPNAHAIVNPSKEGCRYPFPHLSGGGLAYKLVQALIVRGNFIPKQKGWEKWLLDLASISTISDMVPLVGENRALAFFGLRVLQKTPRPGLRTLFRKKRVDQNFITEDDVGFVISPHINAASRMSTPESAFHLLATRDYTEAHKITSHLYGMNENRKKVIEELLKEVDEMLGNNFDGPIISLGNRQWQPGLLGLAASRIVDKYSKPACLWGGEEGDIARGSCRSDGSISVVTLMKNVEGDYFIDHGGHEMSGGFSFQTDKVEIFKEVVLSAYKNTPKESMREPIFIDSKMTLSEVNRENFTEIRRLGPFGVGNPRPIFLFQGLKTNNVMIFGKVGTHMKCDLSDTGGRRISAVKFFIKNDAPNVYMPKSGDIVDLIASIEEDRWRKYPTLRLRVEGIKMSR